MRRPTLQYKIRNLKEVMAGFMRLSGSYARVISLPPQSLLNIDNFTKDGEEQYRFTDVETLLADRLADIEKARSR